MYYCISDVSDPINIKNVSWYEADGKGEGNWVAVRKFLIFGFPTRLKISGKLRNCSMKRQITGEYEVFLFRN